HGPATPASGGNLGRLHLRQRDPRAAGSFRLRNRRDHVSGEVLQGGLVHGRLAKHVLRARRASHDVAIPARSRRSSPAPDVRSERPPAAVRNAGSRTATSTTTLTSMSERLFPY